MVLNAMKRLLSQKRKWYCFVGCNRYIKRLFKATSRYNRLQGASSRKRTNQMEWVGLRRY